MLLFRPVRTFSSRTLLLHCRLLFKSQQCPFVFQSVKQQTQGIRPTGLIFLSTYFHRGRRYPENVPTVYRNHRIPSLQQQPVRGTGSFTEQAFSHSATSNAYRSRGPRTVPRLSRVLDGEIDKDSVQFKENAAKFQELQKQHAALEELAKGGGSQKAKDRHTQLNKKLFITDRLKMLFDDVDDMLELSALQGLQMPYGDIPRSGVLVAIGKVNGVYCLVMGMDATVKAGTVFPASTRKSHRAQEISMENRLPTIYLVDSGGAYLPLQAQIFQNGGRIFYHQGVSNMMDIPQASVVCGSCTAGAAYFTTMSQEAVIVDRIGTMFLGGPPLVKAALGELVTPEELGGGRLHSEVSGSTDYFALDETEAYLMCRDIVACYNIHPPIPPSGFEEPVYSCDDMPGIIPAKQQHTMDIHKVIARIVDGSRFHEFKAIYGTTLVTGFATIHGYLVGIVGNKGELTDNAALKGSHFVQMCTQRDIPLIFLQNTAPMDPPQTAEQAKSSGICIRNRASMMSAVACTHVPKITVIVGNGFGEENYAMAGRSFEPRFLFTWPNSRVAIMEPEKLTEITLNAQEAVMVGSGKSEEERKEVGDKLRKHMEKQTSYFNSSFQGWDDGVILPQDTRKVLGKCLEIIHQAGLWDLENRQPVYRM